MEGKQSELNFRCSFLYESTLKTIILNNHIVTEKDEKNKQSEIKKQTNKRDDLTSD